MNLVLCSSVHCKPCHRLEEYLLKNKVPHQKFTAEDHLGTLTGLDVYSVPVLIARENGVEVDRIGGFNESKIRAFLHGGDWE